MTTQISSSHFTTLLPTEVIKRQHPGSNGDPRRVSTTEVDEFEN